MVGLMLLVIATYTVGCASFLEIIGLEDSKSGEKVMQFLSNTRKSPSNPDSHYLLKPGSRLCL